MNGLRAHWLGVMLLGSLALLNSCRNSNPPAIDICIADGAGGADCILKVDSPLRKSCIQSKPVSVPDAFWCSPMALVNAWMTTQADMAAFSAWAYDADPAAVKQRMADMTAGLKQ